MTDGNHSGASSPDDQLDRELPPVEAPTAGFIVQLFLIPALVVGILVLVYLLFGRIAGTGRTPEDYVQQLRGANVQLRWMAANELAMELQRNADWQDNEWLAGQLAAILEDQLQKGSSPEGSEGSFSEYLAVALGMFNSPTGIPALRLAIQPELPPNVRQQAIVSLGRLADRLGGLPPEAVADLVAAAPDANPEIRKLVALTLGTLDPSQALPALRPMLNDSDREVRYNAAGALARLGSSDGLETLREMLDLDYLGSLASQGQLAEDQLETIPLVALESLSQLLRRSPGIDLEALWPKVESASKNGTGPVRTGAKSLLIELRAAKAR